MYIDLLGLTNDFPCAIMKTSNEICAAQPSCEIASHGIGICIYAQIKP